MPALKKSAQFCLVLESNMKVLIANLFQSWQMLPVGIQPKQVFAMQLSVWFYYRLHLEAEAAEWVKGPLQGSLLKTLISY